MTPPNSAGSRTDRFLKFRNCPHCAYDFVTGEGERSCHYYDCAYLPEELDVRCPTCGFNFITRETEQGCNASSPCDFAQNEARQRVQNVELWLRSQEASKAFG